jgi:hypothetical protein
MVGEVGSNFKECESMDAMEFLAWILLSFSQSVGIHSSKRSGCSMSGLLMPKLYGVSGKREDTGDEEYLLQDNKEGSAYKASSTSSQTLE